MYVALSRESSIHFPNFQILSETTMLQNWPSSDPRLFSELNSTDLGPSKMTPITYICTHDRALPPPDQVIGQEPKNILLRRFYLYGEEKLRPKRASCDDPTPKRACKHARPSADSNSTPS